MEKVINILWRSLLVGVVCDAALVIGGRLVSMVGWNLPVVGNLQARLPGNKDRR